MPVPAAFRGRLRLPAISAPMFLVSGPDLVVETCRCGDGLAGLEHRASNPVAPFGINLVVHRSNRRLDADLNAIDPISDRRREGLEAGLGRRPGRQWHDIPGAAELCALLSEEYRAALAEAAGWR